LIGEGGQRLRLERLAEEVGLRGKKGETRNPGECPRSVEVEFSGALPHSRAMEELRKADLLVLPSRRLPSGDCDGVANVLLEAMANGVPVVTTTGGCAGEVLEHGRNGWLVPPDDPPALASAIRQLLDDDDLRASLAAAARKTLLARFSPGETLHKLSAALSGVVRQPDGSVRDTGF
jgi:glycosyltransferase involved in cell wall biosynthesis